MVAQGDVTDRSASPAGLLGGLHLDRLQSLGGALAFSTWRPEQFLSFRGALRLLVGFSEVCVGCAFGNPRNERERPRTSYQPEPCADVATGRVQLRTLRLPSALFRASHERGSKYHRILSRTSPCHIPCRSIGQQTPTSFADQLGPCLSHTERWRPAKPRTSSWSSPNSMASGRSGARRIGPSTLASALSSCSADRGTFVFLDFLCSSKDKRV